MSKDDVLASIDKIWTVWLYRFLKRKSVHPTAFALLVVIVIWGIGAVGASFGGKFVLYATRPLTYVHPTSVFLFIVAFFWYIGAFCNMVTTIAGAFETSEQKIIHDVRQLASQTAGSPLVLGITTFAMASLQILIFQALNTSTTFGITNYLLESPKWVFQYYLIFCHVVVIGFLLANGAVGIWFSFRVITSILRYQIRLEKYRRLEELGNFTQMLAFWIGIALGFIVGGWYAIATNLFKWQAVPSITLSLIATGLLIAILWIPIIYTGEAIDRSRYNKLPIYEAQLEKVTDEVEDLLRHDKPHSFTNLLEEKARLTQQIEYLHSIPRWPNRPLAKPLIIVSLLAPQLLLVFIQQVEALNFLKDQFNLLK